MWSNPKRGVRQYEYMNIRYRLLAMAISVILILSESLTLSAADVSNKAALHVELDGQNEEANAQATKGELVECDEQLTSTELVEVGELKEQAQETDERPEEEIDETVENETVENEIEDESWDLPNEIVEPEYDDNTITAIQALETREFVYEYKLCLERLLEDFPKSLTVTLGAPEGIELVLNVNWVCSQDYDQYLGEYDFVPDLYDFGLADGVEVPHIHVVVQDESEGPADGLCEFDDGLEVPILNRNTKFARLYAAAMPSEFNGYEEGYLPIVHNQGSDGTCWAFGTLGAMETDLILHDGADRSIDLSEFHAAYFGTHMVADPLNCRQDTIICNGDYIHNGGDSALVYRAVAANIGAINEEELPYEKIHSLTPDVSYAMNYNSVGLNAAYVINAEDRDSIKQAILDHGSVSAAMYSTVGSYTNDDGAKCQVRYSATYNSFYSDYPKTNHKIMLVGWDDHFSKDNFYAGCQPEDDGAWLVRNSWGLDDYGKNGYFWLSYYDAGLLTGKAYAFDASFKNYDNVYGYDGTYFTTWKLYTGGTSRTNTLEQSYLMGDDEVVKAIGFETGSSNVSANVKVTCGDQTAEGSIITSFAGFYMCNLESWLHVTKGQKVTVEIKLSTPDTYLHISRDRTLEYGCISFKSSKDSDLTINGNAVDFDTIIKMYTDSDETSSRNSAKLETNSIYNYSGTQVQLSLTEDSTVPFSDISWSSLDTEIATVSEDGLVTIGNKKGTTRIVGSFDAGTVTRTITCAVKVKPYHIAYVLPDDAKIIHLDEEYYPGDAEHCNLPKYQYCGVYRIGYKLSGWCTDENLTQAIMAENLANDVTGDLTLYPVWEEVPINVGIYKIDENGEYSSSRFRYDDLISPTQLPYSVHNLTKSLRAVNSWLSTYNETHEPMRFAYWSYDADGEQPVSSLTGDDYHMKLYNGGTDYAYYYQSGVVGLYPQLEPLNAKSVAVVDSVSIIAGGKVGLKFNLDFSRMNEEDLADGYVMIWEQGRENEALSVPLSQPERFVYPVNVKEMDKEISIRVYGLKDQVISFSDDDIYTCSVNDYLNKAESLTDAKHLELTRSLATLGAISKAYFGECSYSSAYDSLSNTIGTENAEKTIEKLSLVNQSDVNEYAKKIRGELPEGIEYVGSSLLLLSGTVIRHYFVLDKGMQAADFSFEVNSTELVSAYKSDRIIYVDIEEDIPAAEYDKYVPLRVSACNYGNETDTYFELDYCVNSYICSVINAELADSGAGAKVGSEEDSGAGSGTLENGTRSHPGEILDVARALYLYGKAAKTYFE